MTPNQFEKSRAAEGTMRNAGHESGLVPNQSQAISRDDERDGAVQPATIDEASAISGEANAPAGQRQGKRRVLAASTLTGDRVRNGKGEALGTIDEIMVDLKTGRIAYAVLSYGGFLGIGDKLFAVPWRALRVDQGAHEFIFDVDRKLLENAPGFDKHNWPDMADPAFEKKIHDYYESQIWWEQRVTDAGDFTGAEHFPDQNESSSRWPGGGTRH
ncbi:MAG TPA: PRC-barrel domain-containing protein [Bryobacteraceae bacterium]|jgi:sporulation protein YlmC with PRC-barrel domain|nr:PRC-barrel domain-containing protein [Bryobacteraceae bacterium]